MSAHVPIWAYLMLAVNIVPIWVGAIAPSHGIETWLWAGTGVFLVAHVIVVLGWNVE